MRLVARRKYRRLEALLLALTLQLGLCWKSIVHRIVHKRNEYPRSKSFRPPSWRRADEP